MAFLGALVRGAARARTGYLSGKSAGESEGRKRRMEDEAARRAQQKLDEDIAYRLLQQQIREDELARRAAQDAATAERYAAERAERERHNKAMEQAARDRNRRLGRRGDGGPDPKTKLTQLGQQIDDTARDLAAERREAPKRPLFFPSEADSLAFEGARTENQGRISQLLARRDSLERERDRLAAATDQRPVTTGPARTAPGGDPRQRITQDQADYLREVVGMPLAEIQRRYIIVQ